MYGAAPVFKILLHAYALYCDLSVDFRLCVIMNIFGEHVQNRYLLFTCNTDNSACMTWVGVLQRVMEMYGILQCLKNHHLEMNLTLATSHITLRL